MPILEIIAKILIVWIIVSIPAGFMFWHMIFSITNRDDNTIADIDYRTLSE